MHNPYFLSDLEHLKNAVVHGCNICIGMFGEMQDLDRKKKIKYIESLKEVLRDYVLEYQIDYVEKNNRDSYYNVLYVDQNREKITKIDEGSVFVKEGQKYRHI